jgi:hypothetical protein
MLAGTKRWQRVADRVKCIAWIMETTVFCTAAAPQQCTQMVGLLLDRTGWHGQTHCHQLNGNVHP